MALKTPSSWSIQIIPKSNDKCPYKNDITEPERT